jgi:small subunit ribosomal protein S20
MPITKSAQKSLRQNKRRAIRNVKRKRKIKDLMKEVKKLISQNKAKEARKLLPEIYKSLDKAAKTKVIKKNTASRKKSRITKAIIKQIK